MAGRLAGKRILVTAAGAGIGRATVLMMAAEGAQVIATDVKAELLDALCGPEPARPEHEQQYEYDEDMCPLHQRASTVDKMV